MVSTTTLPHLDYRGTWFSYAQATAQLRGRGTLDPDIFKPVRDHLTGLARTLNFVRAINEGFPMAGSLPGFSALQELQFLEERVYSGGRLFPDDLPDKINGYLADVTALTEKKMPSDPAGTYFFMVSVRDAYSSAARQLTQGRARMR